MATKRPENPTKPPKWFNDYMRCFNEKLSVTLADLMKEIKSINARLDVIVKVNNLTDPTVQK